MSQTVYILYSPLVDRYFVGRTSNFDKAIERHNTGKNPHTKTGLPWNTVYRETFDSADDARRREIQIKSSQNRDELAGFIRDDRNEIQDE
jgi:putative endonuclease